MFLDEQWMCMNFNWNFERFETPHPTDAAQTFLKDVATEWELGKDTKAKIMDDYCHGRWHYHFTLRIYIQVATTRGYVSRALHPSYHEKSCEQKNVCDSFWSFKDSFPSQLFVDFDEAIGEKFPAKSGSDM